MKLRNVGRKAGEAAGSIIEQPFSHLGKKYKNDDLTGLGQSIKGAYQSSFETAGQIADGLVGMTSGLVKKDSGLAKEGLDDLKEVAVRTGKGVAGSVKNTIESGGQMYTGSKTGDKAMLLEGSKGIAKALIVSTVTFSVMDALGAFEGDAEAAEIDTRNDELAGTIHPETGVPFIEEELELQNGDEISGVFPDFEEVYAVSLPDSMYLDSDLEQFTYANLQLSYSMETDPALQGLFTPDQLQNLALGETPEGYTWHHSEVTGRLELVDTETHAQTGHTGGRELWGGGGEYR